MSKMADVFIEAAERMELLGFDKNGKIYKDILSGEKVWCSDNSIGKVTELTEEQKDHIREFEGDKFIVYHVIRADFGVIGILDAYLYVDVSMEKCENQMCRDDIKESCPIAYVRNITDPELSEFGSIGVINVGNYLVRTA